MKRINIHSMDEMEKSIVLKSQRNALIYLSAALLIWILYDLYKFLTVHNSMINLTPLFLLCTAGLVQNFSEIYLRKHMVKGDDEYQEKYPFSRIVLITFFFGVIAAVILMSLFIAFYIEGI